QNATAIEVQVDSIRGRQDFLRERIKFALAQTTGFDSVDNPELWTKQYDDYYGYYTPQAAKPVTRTAQNYYETTVPMYQPPMRHSCFPAGTPVVTSVGLLPIEQIKPGDRVLAQDVETGELAFKPVQVVTLRRNTALKRITFGSQTIEATLGHPFW